MAKKIKPLTKENSNRRHGDNCAKCNCELGKFRLDGRINGESISFCSFDCHDSYVYKLNAEK